MSVAALRQKIALALPANSLRGRFASGASWLLVGSIASQLITAAGSIITARVLGRSAYGELGIVVSTLAMFTVVAELSLGLTANKHIAEFRTTNPARAGKIVGLASLIAIMSGSAMAVLLFIFSSTLATNALGKPEVAGYLRLASPIILLSAVMGLQAGAMSGFEAFKKLTTCRVTLAIATTPLIIAGVLLGGIKGVIIATLVSSLCNILWIRFMLKQECRKFGISIQYRGVWSEKRVIWRFALPAMCSGLMYTPVIWSANALLVNRGGGFGELGAFNAANQWRSLILWVPGTLSEVALPMFSNLLALGEVARFKRALKLNVMANATIGFMAATPVAALGYWIMRLYGPSFAPHWPALSLLAVAAALQAVNGVMGQALAAVGKMWWGLAINGLWAIELLTATFLLLRLGATGLAIAYMISYILFTVQVWICMTLLWKHIIAERSAAPTAATRSVYVSPA